MDSLNLRSRLHQLDVRAAQLEGARKADAAQSAQLHQDVARAKGRQTLGEEVARVFEALQQRAHQRSVGAFERLLSAILNDVLPDEGTVRLLPQFKSNTTWLDIALEKQGQLENVVDGNGGAVTNVVCAGLRFAALSRTDNRRLMVLDEPDCWLKPERVPAFVRVVSQVATQTGTQTFIISHHDPAFFEGQVNLVRFHAEASGKVCATPLAPQVAAWADDTQPGVRAIELVNVRRHEHTFVPCFPGATAFIGDNNLGKSTAIVTSFKAVAYGESDDSLIRHGCTQARIIFHLENNERIEWSRDKKRSPAVLYQHWRGDVLLQEGRPKTRNQAPEWVTEVLGVTRVDDLDIQVGNQKSPVFLLNDSAPRQAQILSVGRESGHLKTLMKKYDEVKSSDREIVKQGELNLARLKVRLGYLAKLAPLPPRLADLLAVSEGLLRHIEGQETLQKLTERLTTLEQSTAQLAREAGVLTHLPDAPLLQDEVALERLLPRLDKLAAVACVPVPTPVPDVPVLADEAGLLQLMTRLTTLNRLAGIAAPALVPEIPVLTDSTALLALGQKLALAERTVAACAAVPTSLPDLPQTAEVEPLRMLADRLAQQSLATQAAETELTTVDRDMAQLDRALAELKKELGDECPLCGAAFPEKGIEHHVHLH